MIRILTIFFLFINLALANVVLQAPSTYISGEPLKFSIEYSGSEEPSFPNIDKIDGFRVQSAGKSSQISIINGNRSQTITQNYVLFPDKDITIPAFEIKTSSKVFKTEAKEVLANTPSKTSSNEFDLSLELDKDKGYIGESFILTLKFKYKLGTEVLNMELNQPNFDGFWVKSLGKSKREIEEGYDTHTLRYMIFPQRSGNLSLAPVSINVALPDDSTRNYSLFRTQAKVKRVYSNRLSLDIKPLPNGLKLIGDFDISAEVDKSEVKLGEAVSYKIKISGKGNLDDLEDIKLNIPDATIYENKPEKNFELIDGEYKGVYTKSFSIVANNSFTIKPIVLEYFDKEEQREKSIETKEFDIKILGEPKVKQEVVLQKAKPEVNVEETVVMKSASTKDKTIFFILGLVCGCLLIIILYYFKNLKKQKVELEKPLLKVVKTTSTKNELLKTLAPYVNKDKELDTLIYTLESISEDQVKEIKKQILAKLKKLNF